MARSKSDISNSAIRIFLQDVGKFYDEQRGFEPFGPKVGQVTELLQFFNGECCYCGVPISKKTISLDHLIPMNKGALGLHARGNDVAWYWRYGGVTQQKSWLEFFNAKAFLGMLKLNCKQVEV